MQAMDINNIFTAASIILKGLKNLRILTEGEQRIISDLILHFDQLKDIYLLRKYNTLLFRLIELIQVREYKAQSFIYEDGNHEDMKYFLASGQVAYTRQNKQLCQASFKQILFQKLEEKSQVNASENKKRAFKLIQDMKYNRTKPVRDLHLGELFGSREDYNDHLVFKSRKLEMEYIKQQEQLDLVQSLSVQAQSDCIVLCISQKDYESIFKQFTEKLSHLITALSQNLMNVVIEDSEKYITEYFAHFIDENVYQQKEIVIQQGTATNYLFFIKSGHVQIQKSMTELYRYGANQYILQKNFLNQKTYDHNVQVIEPETVITRIQRYFIYLLLKIKSLNSSIKQSTSSSSSKMSIQSLYFSNSQKNLMSNSSQSTSNSQSTQSSIANNAQNSSSQHSGIRHTQTVLDFSTLISSSNSQKEIVLPTFTHTHSILSNTSYSALPSSNVHHQTAAISQSSSGSNLQSHQTVKRMSAKILFSNQQFNNSSSINTNTSITDNNQENAFISARTPSSSKRRIIIPTKNKIFQNFQRSISANLRKFKPTKQENTQQEHHNQENQKLGTKESMKHLLTNLDQFEGITNISQSVAPSSSSMKAKQKGAHPLKRMQTVSFSTNINEEDEIISNNLNISSFCPNEKDSYSKLFSQQNSLSSKKDTPTQAQKILSKKYSSFLKPKILNIQDIFPESHLDVSSPQQNQLTCSANLNDHSYYGLHSKFSTTTSSSIFQQMMTKNFSTPSLTLKRIPQESANDFEIGKQSLTSRVLTPTLTQQQQYFVSQNKYGKHRSIYNSNHSSLPLKNSNLVKSQPLKKSIFVSSNYDNSHQSINNSNHII